MWPFGLLLCSAGFGLLVLLILAFRKWWRVRVSCWFCHADVRIPFRLRNCWDCPHCDQYNGFTESGDYNKTIPAMYEEENKRFTKSRPRYSPPPSEVAALDSRNGLCARCNENQTLKIRQLANFKPSCEELFDDELNSFKRRLEQIYALCSNCQKHLQTELICQNKKLGSIADGSAWQNGGSFLPSMTSFLKRSFSVDKDIGMKTRTQKGTTKGLFAYMIPLCQMMQIVLFSTLWISDLCYVIRRNGIFEATTMDLFIFGDFLTMVTTYFKIMALGGLILQFTVMGLKYSYGIKNGLLPLFFATFNAAIAADVFNDPDQTPKNFEKDRKHILQLFFETAAIVACLADFISMTNHKNQKIHVEKFFENRSVKSQYVNDSSLRGRPIQGFDTIDSPRKPAQKHRQRRDSASPGRVGNMLSTLSLGRSDCVDTFQKSSSTNFFSPILFPAKFQATSPFSQTSSSLKNSANSSYNEQSLLWPSRFQTTKKTTNGTNSDNDDIVSVFSSISQRLRRPTPNKEIHCPHSHWTTDWFWKLLISLVLLCSFSTNAVVLYYLLTRG